ncbi:hypothetical protein CC2G_004711 [Coprinopsis cinerea AmutBmut pab1-1]|nr:hypothetical protein CC2G_004711 [Coprinopsis cinerea AmutBmut pab1-1]
MRTSRLRQRLSAYFAYSPLHTLQHRLFWGWWCRVSEGSPVAVFRVVCGHSVNLEPVEIPDVTSGCAVASCQGMFCVALRLVDEERDRGRVIDFVNCQDFLSMSNVKLAKW